MIDEALLRPGRLELKMQIGDQHLSAHTQVFSSVPVTYVIKWSFLNLKFVGLPDTAGRQQIFSIHTKQMRENKMMANDVDIKELAG